MEEYLEYSIPRYIEFLVMESTPYDTFESKDKLKNKSIPISKTSSKSKENVNFRYGKSGPMRVNSKISFDHITNLPSCT